MAESQCSCGGDGENYHNLDCLYEYYLTVDGLNDEPEEFKKAIYDAMSYIYYQEKQQ